MKPTELTILIGNIASGKTEFTRRYLQRPENKDTVVLSKDAMRWGLGGGYKYKWSEDTEKHIHKSILDSMGRYLADGMNVVYDETNMNRETREPFIDVAKLVFNGFVHTSFDIRAIVLLPTLSVDEAMRRRCGYSGEAWGFPESRWREAWHRKNRLFEPPSYDEGFTTITSVGGF